MPQQIEIEHSTRLLVGMADLAVSRESGVLLTTMPLGSCLGVGIYDPTVRVGGILHSLLPASSLDPRRADSHPGMFLDTGLQILFARARQLNATLENIRVIVAGAAEMMDESPEYNVGRSNCRSLGQLLSQLGVEIYAQYVGGKTDCSMELAVATGEVRLKFCGEDEAKVLCRP